MDPLTHMVTGALVAQTMAPEEHRFAFALVAAGAGVVPDIDFVARKAKKKLLFLKFHRGFTHSLVAVPIIAMCAAGSGHLLFGAPFWLLAAASAVAALSHLVLDTIMHSTGLRLLWPSRRKTCMHLVVGLNPLTSSARCGERSLMVCMRCTMHSAVINPMVLLLWAGFAVSLVVPWWQVLSSAIVAATLGYLLQCRVLRWLARRALARHVARQGDRGAAEEAASARTFPASFNPARWIGVTTHDQGYRVWSVSAAGGAVESIGEHGLSGESEAVEQSRRTETVQEFMANAVFPHATEYPVAKGTLVVWRDLAFAFSPAVSLFAARVELDHHQGVQAEEFRERWDRPPETV